MLYISKLRNMLKFKNKGKSVVFFVLFCFLFRNSPRYSQLQYYAFVCQVQIICLETLCEILLINFDPVYEEKLCIY